MHIVECYGNEADFKNRRCFRCDSKVWDEILAEGVKWGWKPLGTTPSENDTSAHTDDCHGYRCVDILWARSVSDDDAQNLAEALVRAVPHRERNENFLRADAPLPIRRFHELIKFLRGGGFDFFWDD